MNLEMGLSTKQVSGDWSHSFLPELPKPFPARGQQHQQEQLKCPRCDSSNTKFCYYNNYNKSQPRHFCKACKRHWTKGGTLRNVPVGGGRKNKRAKRSNSVDRKKNHTRSESQNFVLPIDGQKNTYHSFIRPTSLLPDCSINGFADKILFGNNCNFLPVNQNQVPQYSFSSLSSFDAYNSAKKLEEVMEDPINSLVCDQPWQLVPSTSSAMEVPNYWSWGDLETMLSADLNVAWDDTGVES